MLPTPPNQEAGQPRASGGCLLTWGPLRCPCMKTLVTNSLSRVALSVMCMQTSLEEGRRDPQGGTAAGAQGRKRGGTWPAGRQRSESLLHTRNGAGAQRPPEASCSLLPPGWLPACSALSRHCWPTGLEPPVPKLSSPLHPIQTRLVKPVLPQPRLEREWEQRRPCRGQPCPPQYGGFLLYEWN